MISVSVNGSAAAQVHRGWPVIVELTTIGDDAKDEPRVTVLDAQFKPVDWPLQAIQEPPASPDGARTRSWVIGADASAALADGDYEVAVQLRRGDDVIASSAPAQVKVSAAPAVAVGDVPDDLRMLRVQYQALTGHQADAEREVAEWVQQHPKSVAAQTSAGDIALAAGRLQEAKQAYDQAMTAALAASAKRRIKEPPEELAERQNAVIRAMVQESIDQKRPTTRKAPRP